MPPRWGICALLVLALTACAGSTASTDRSAPPSTSPTSTSTTLAPASQPLVAFEASWLCQVQRFAFANPSDIEAGLQTALTDAGSTLPEYSAFKSGLAQNPSLRAEIRQRFQAQCTASEPVTESTNSDSPSGSA